MKREVLHNKLVRDKVPERLRKSGIEVEVEMVKDRVRHLRLLIDHLEEAAQDVALVDEEHILEELGNVETTVDGILKKIGKTRLELREQQENMDDEDGALEEGVFLIKTIEDE